MGEANHINTDLYRFNELFRMVKDQKIEKNSTRTIDKRQLVLLVKDFIGKNARKILIICASKQIENLDETKNSIDFGSGLYDPLKKAEIIAVSSQELLNLERTKEIEENRKKVWNNFLI